MQQSVFRSNETTSETMMSKAKSCWSFIGEKQEQQQQKQNKT